MLRYGINDVSEEIDIDKTNTSKESAFVTTSFFLDKSSKFQQNICNVSMTY